LAKKKTNVHARAMLCDRQSLLSFDVQGAYNTAQLARTIMVHENVQTHSEV